MMKHKIIFTLAMLFSTIGMSLQAKTMVVYYSYTGNCKAIVEELTNQITADVLEIQPAEKGLKYEANNYAIGSEQIAAIRSNPDDAESYPTIDPISIDWEDYNNIIIVTPLWWSQMAAPMQTFLFQNGAKMAGKNVGLIASSASSGISSLVADFKRLVPEGNYLSENLWIKSSQVSNASSMISAWLTNIDFPISSEERTSVKTINSDKFPKQSSKCLDKNGKIIINEKYDISGKQI